MIILAGVALIIAVIAWRCRPARAAQPARRTPYDHETPTQLHRGLAADYRTVARAQRRDGMPGLAATSDALADHHEQEARSAQR